MKEIHPNPEGKAQRVKVKVRINLHGIMAVSSASMYESKESPEPETPTEQSNQQQNENGGTAGANNEQQQAPADGVANGTPEVGSSWTKKFTAWFSGVRIRTCRRWPGILFFVVPFRYSVFSTVFQFGFCFCQSRGDWKFFVLRSIDKI